MYLAQIKLPPEQVVNEKVNSNKPDRFLLEQIFKQLHLQRGDSKFLISFPDAQEQSIGRYIHLFAKDRSALEDTLKKQKILNLVGNFCELKISCLDELNFNETYQQKIKKTGEVHFPLSKIKRHAKRQNGKIAELIKEGKSELEIFELIKNQRVKNKHIELPFVKYRATNNRDAKFFIKIINENK